MNPDAAQKRKRISPPPLLLCGQTSQPKAASKFLRIPAASTSRGYGCGPHKGQDPTVVDPGPLISPATPLTARDRSFGSSSRQNAEAGV